MRSLFLTITILFNLLYSNIIVGTPVYNDDDKPGAIKGVIIDKTSGQAM